MYSLVLFIHIAIAVLTIMVSVVAIINATGTKAGRAIKQMWGAFIGTMISGVALVAIAPQSLGHFCVIASCYVVALVLVHRYVDVRQKLVTDY